MKLDKFTQLYYPTSSHEFIVRSFGSQNFIILQKEHKNMSQHNIRDD